MCFLFNRIAVGTRSRPPKTPRDAGSTHAHPQLYGWLKSGKSQMHIHYTQNNLPANPRCGVRNPSINFSTLRRGHVAQVKKKRPLARRAIRRPKPMAAAVWEAI